MSLLLETACAKRNAVLYAGIELCRWPIAGGWRFMTKEAHLDLWCVICQGLSRVSRDWKSPGFSWTGDFTLEDAAIKQLARCEEVRLRQSCAHLRSLWPYPPEGVGWADLLYLEDPARCQRTIP